MRRWIGGRVKRNFYRISYSSLRNRLTIIKWCMKLYWQPLIKRGTIKELITSFKSTKTCLRALHRLKQEIKCSLPRWTTWKIIREYIKTQKPSNASIAKFSSSQSPLLIILKCAIKRSKINVHNSLDYLFKWLSSKLESIWMFRTIGNTRSMWFKYSLMGKYGMYAEDIKHSVNSMSP